MDEVKRRQILLNLLPPKGSAMDTASLHQGLRRQGVKVSLRGVQRDLAMLLDEHKPHVQREQVGRGYSWSATRVLSRLSLLPTDAMNLLMIMDHAERFGMQAQVANLSTLRDYANSLLRDSRPSDDWTAKITSTTRFITLRPGRVDPVVLRTLQQALLDDQSVKVQYIPRGAREPRVYVLKPLGLSYQDSNIYLSCIFENHRKDDPPRALPLHRFVSARETVSSISTPLGYNINSVAARRSLVDLKSDTPLTLRLRLSKGMYERLQENPMTDDQEIVRESDDCWIMKASMLPSQGLKLWLLSQGDMLEVLEPVELREEVASIAANMNAIYRRG